MSISTDYTTQIIQQAKNAWTAQNKTVTNFFNKYDDAVYSKEIAPGRNRAVYLLGHLIAVNDGMIKLFGIGDRLYADLDETFIKAADKTVDHIPSVSELKQHWQTLNEALTKRFDEMTTADWMGKHTAVSEEDFVKEPLRNKLNVLIGRTNHQSYHMGQLTLISA